MGKHSEKKNQNTKNQEKPQTEEKQERTGAETEAPLKELQSRLEEKEKEAAENYDKYLRISAELDNYKKHAARERADLIKFSNETIIKDILPVMDSLDRALDHAQNAGGNDKFLHGLKIIHSQLLQFLEKHGVRRVESVGKEFDPNIHEAVLKVESKEHGDNEIIEEFEKGYLLHNRLLKPAKVSVSKHVSDDEDKSQGNT